MFIYSFPRPVTLLVEFEGVDDVLPDAVRGNGLEAFKECLQEIILKSRIRIERVFPYSEAGKIQLIRQFGQLESEEYTEDGIKVLAYVPKEIEGKL